MANRDDDVSAESARAAVDVQERDGSGGEPRRDIPPVEPTPEQKAAALPDDPLTLEPPLITTPSEKLRLFDQHRLAPATFVVLVILTVIGLVYVFRYFIHDLIIAFVLVALFHPIWVWLERRLGGRPWLASWLVTALIILVLAVPLAFLILTIGQQATQLLDTVRVFLASEAADEQIYKQVNLYLGEVGVTLSREDMSALAQRFQLYAQELAFTSVGSVVSTSVSLILHVVVVFVAVFYLLVDGIRLREFVFELSPLPLEEDRLIVEKFQHVTRGILVGNGLGSLIQSVLAGMAMWLAGIPGVVFWMAVMTVLAFLPIIGISFVTVPASIYLFWVGKPVTALVFFLFCGAVSLFVDSIVKAWLIGARTRMHDLLVFLSIVGGIAAFGVMGLLYGPLLVAVFLTLSTLYLQSYHQKLASSWRRAPDSTRRE